MGFLLHPLSAQPANSNCYQGTRAREKDDKRDARGGGKRLLGKGVKARERARNSGGEWTVLDTRVRLEARQAPRSDTLKTALGRHSPGVGDPDMTCVPLWVI